MCCLSECPFCSMVSDHVFMRSGSLGIQSGVNTDFFLFQTMPLTIYTGGAKGGNACRTIMSPLWSFVCGHHPTMSPSSQVPRTLDPARLGRGHPHCQPGGF